MKSCIVVLLCVLACACGSSYREKDGRIVFVTANEGQGTVVTVVQDADRDSFRDLGNGYARDKDRAYHGAATVPGARAASFVVLAQFYAKDDTRVYFRNSPIAHADPASFAIIDPNYARDKNDVYMQGEPMHACDPASFHLLEDEIGQDWWGLDNRCAYRANSRLPGADPGSFRVLDAEYAKDAMQAYSATTLLVRDADAATFALAKGPCAVCARDKYRCYSSGKPTSCNTRFFER